jgi:hypothetical protein
VFPRKAGDCDGELDNLGGLSCRWDWGSTLVLLLSRERDPHSQQRLLVTMATGKHPRSCLKPMQFINAQSSERGGHARGYTSQQMGPCAGVLLPLVHLQSMNSASPSPLRICVSFWLPWQHSSLLSSQRSTTSIQYVEWKCWMEVSSPKQLCTYRY